MFVSRIAGLLAFGCVCLFVAVVQAAPPHRLAPSGLQNDDASRKQLVSLKPPHDPAGGVTTDAVADPVPEPAMRHIELVLVGDTGFAPHRQRPLPDGVYKHGRWQTWESTTRLIRPHINGDINFANVESVVSANGRLRARPKAYNFMTHPNGMQHLVDVGFNLFSMANNHAFDYGASGIRDSLRHMNDLKGQGILAHAGIGLNRAEALETPVFEKNGTRFAFGAIGIGASYGGLPRAGKSRPGQLGINNKQDYDALMVGLANADADYRILSVHKGLERKIRPSGNEIHTIRNRTLDQGNVDLLIGHHAHVTRGVELNKGRLVFYGLGNFLHHGTANMAGGGGCRDYSIMARVHLTAKGSEKPKLAAVQVVPITSTHMQTALMSPRRATKRIGILNGLAHQLDDPAAGAKGLRFVPQSDGSGLFCTADAAIHARTGALCKNYNPDQLASARVQRSAVATCGSSYRPKLRVAAGTVQPVSKSHVSKSRYASSQSRIRTARAGKRYRSKARKRYRSSVRKRYVAKSQRRWKRSAKSPRRWKNRKYSTRKAKRHRSYRQKRKYSRRNAAKRYRISKTKRKKIVAKKSRRLERRASLRKRVRARRKARRLKRHRAAYQARRVSRKTRKGRKRNRRRR